MFLVSFSCSSDSSELPGFSNLPSSFCMILRWAGFVSRVSCDDILSSLLLLAGFAGFVMGCDEILSYPLLLCWDCNGSGWVCNGL